jgi:uncharacterized LabA/DUF88 family protein
MNGDAYLFIDGGHLRKNHAEVVGKWFGHPVPDFNLDDMQNSLGAQKCFYYDCLDNKRRSTESPDDFDKRLVKQKELFNRFRRTKNTHVRLGALIGNGKKIRQKRVDIQLAVDAMSHAARGNMRTTVLLSGDQDFAPLVESLVSMGLFVHVCGDVKHTSRALADSADTFRPLRFKDYFYWTDDTARSKKPLPEMYIGGSPTPNSPPRIGTVAGIPAKLYVQNDGQTVITVETPDAIKMGTDSYEIIRHRDESRVIEFVALQIGEVDGF